MTNVTIDGIEYVPKSEQKDSSVLKFAWGLRIKLCAEGDKLWAEGNKLCAEGDKLRAEGNKLWAEGDKLRAEGNKLWAETILLVHGNIQIEWKNMTGNLGYECHLETGEVFKPSDVDITK